MFQEKTIDRHCWVYYFTSTISHCPYPYKYPTPPPPSLPWPRFLLGGMGERQASCRYGRGAVQAHGGLREEQWQRVRNERANGLRIGGVGVRQNEMGCLRRQSLRAASASWRWPGEG